eukprot:GEZU01015077.1.p1 GENE.GEZU01015077.1~~GEZU01015077.1.p1  ORF type:complete len:162 (-),score=41.68 GEZU01015077.1:381-866(-)
MKSLTDITLCPRDAFEEKLLLLIMAACSRSFVSWLLMEGRPLIPPNMMDGVPPSTRRPALFTRLFFMDVQRGFNQPDPFLKKLVTELIYQRGEGPCTSTLLREPLASAIKQVQQKQQQQFKEQQQQRGSINNKNNKKQKLTHQHHYQQRQPQQHQRQQFRT